MDKIMKTFRTERSRNAVVERMCELGLVADRIEICPSKQKNVTRNHESVGEKRLSDDYDSSEDELSLTRSAKRNENTTLNKKQKRNFIKLLENRTLNAEEIHHKVGGIDHDLKIHIRWIQESLDDAAEDYDDSSCGPNDGVPIVPFSLAQKKALDNIQFKDLLLSIGLQKPSQNMVS